MSDESTGEKLKGVAKEVAGKATGADDVQREGEAQQKKAQKDEEASRLQQEAAAKQQEAAAAEGAQRQHQD